jgi:hypothetical protein
MTRKAQWKSKRTHISSHFENEFSPKEKKNWLPELSFASCFPLPSLSFALALCLHAPAPLQQANPNPLTSILLGLFCFQLCPLTICCC